jgi:Kef-type K+ transport system membrane component KefB/nucleotide-binding universal stress UspA family protein
LLRENQIMMLLQLTGSDPQAAAQSGEHAVALFIIAIGIILLVGRLLGELMQRIGQPAVMGQLLAGVIIGQSVLGKLWPSAYQQLFAGGTQQKNMVDAIAQLGVLMLLLLTGMETDLSLINRMRRTALYTSLSGIVLPFACGYVLGQFLPESLLPDPGRRLATSLFLATALSISSVKIVAMVLMEVDFLRRNVGQIILASAILDDTTGWIIIAIISGLAFRGSVDLAGVIFIVAGAALFIVFSFTLGRRWVAYAIRWSNDRLVIEMPVITTILIVMCAMAALTEKIGVHTVLGAFVAGILIGQSPILTRHIQEQLRGLIVALFMPVFFTVAGLSTDLAVFNSSALIKLELILIVIASFGKLAGCYGGGRLGGLGHRQSVALAIGMNARGSTEVIIATIGLSIGVLSRDLYTLIVFMAIATTLITPPLLRWALARIPPTGEERERLERERAEAGDFIPRLERLLIAADAGTSGRLASRIAGLLAGTRHVMTTVLELGLSSGSNHRPGATEIVKESAGEASGAIKRLSDSGALPEAPQVQTGQTKSSDVTGVVLAEAGKGYDLLVLGIEHALSTGHPGTSSAEVEKIFREFHNPIALAIPRGKHLNNPTADLTRILVPAIGTDYSRLAAEVAIAIARASKSSVTALNVSRTPRSLDLLRSRSDHYLKTAKAAVRDVQELGDREGVTVQPLAVSGRDQDATILRQIKKGKYDLVVIGVKTRPHHSEGLFFGGSVAALLEGSPCSLLVVRS